MPHAECTQQLPSHDHLSHPPHSAAKSKDHHKHHDSHALNPPPVPDADADAPGGNIHTAGRCPCVAEDNSHLGHFRRRQSQQSDLARRAMASSHRGSLDMVRQRTNESVPDENDVDDLRTQLDHTLSPNGGVFGANDNALPPLLPEGHRPQRTPALPDNDTGDLRPVPVAVAVAVAVKQPFSMAAALHGHIPPVDRPGASLALNDTPATTAPSSPRILPMRQNSGTSTPRVRPTTLDIPGLTKSKVSPDGRIAQRDVGAKLVIVMVGLPARGKSYITKKLARYLNWLQHDTRIFNVGERRRVVAGGPNNLKVAESQRRREQTIRETHRPSLVAPLGLQQQQELASDNQNHIPPSAKSGSVAHILLNGDRLEPPGTPTKEMACAVLDDDDDDDDDDETPGAADRGDHAGRDSQSRSQAEEPLKLPDAEAMEQNSSFFDPNNKQAALIREQVALETLDELLDYILEQNGSVGIFDATNSTLERRKMIMKHIRQRAGPELNVLFLESSCVNQDLLEANMRLKLNGPDYRTKDPVTALTDFKKRVKEYEKAYVPLGDYEERNNMPYIQMVDVGRKVISHQIRGFLSAQANYYLLNFNLAPRQIWITRHGLSLDNLSGKIGGDSDLAPEGIRYAQSLTRFIDQKRIEWDEKQVDHAKRTHFPPQPGDVTPPNPHYTPASHPDTRVSSVASDAGSVLSADESPPYEHKNFCVWTSMLKRSIQTAQFFNDEDYDSKQMRMLDELNAGVMEGLTYSCISTQFPEEYASRKADKLHYRYPGPGGEGYLDIINRLRPVIVELERMTDHVLLVGHRSVARVLLAYFRGLKREEVADLDVPLGMLYCLEPKPYGVDFQAYKWDREAEWFFECPNFELRRAEDDMQ